MVPKKYSFRTFGGGRDGGGGGGGGKVNVKQNDLFL